MLRKSSKLERCKLAASDGTTLCRLANRLCRRKEIKLQTLLTARVAKPGFMKEPPLWLVARGNYSRIGIARVIFNQAGDPCGVERLGIALEPEADYERRSDGGGGCEDPRILFVEPLQRYVMAYAALCQL